MTITHYNSSRGALLIADMAYPHVTNALAKMEREGRQDEVYAALKARLEDFPPQDNEPAAREAVIGDNGAPQSTTFEAIKERVEDLRIEAKNWMDGSPIENAAQAGAVETLLEQVRAVKSDADKAREAEKKPHMEEADRIQAQYNTIIGKTKKVTGTALVIEDAILAALTKWRNKVAAEKAETLRLLEAERAAQTTKALEAFQESTKTSDLDQREAALVEIEKAREAAFAFSSAQKTVEVKGLKTVYSIEVTDYVALARYAWTAWGDDLKAWLFEQAQRQVRATSGNSQIDGVKILSEKVAR